MGIEQIEIEGFRSLKHVVWEPSNLNVLIGPNGSGKSNLLRALETLSTAAQGRLDEAVDRCGGFTLAAWNHKAQVIAWRTRLALPHPAELPPTEGPGTAVTHTHEYGLELRRRGGIGEFIVGAESLSVGMQLVFESQNTRGSYQLRLSRLELDPSGVAPHDVLLAVCSRFPSASEQPGLRIVQRFLAEAKCYQDVLVDPGADIRRSTKARREDRVQPDGQNLASFVHTHYQKNDAFTVAVDDAMRAAFGDDFVRLLTPPAEDTRVHLQVKWQSLSEPMSATELSDGVLRFLVLIAILSQPDPPPLIAIDEPETGLHPRMQHIIAEYAVEASRKTQVILTTHSPEFLDAFRDTIPKVTVAFWEDGQTVLKTPPEDVLKDWLKQYTLGSLMSSGELEGEAE